jgi:hypothetical protein
MIVQKLLVLLLTLGAAAWMGSLAVTSLRDGYARGYSFAAERSKSPILFWFQVATMGGGGALIAVGGITYAFTQ